MIQDKTEVDKKRRVLLISGVEKQNDDDDDDNNNNNDDDDVYDAYFELNGSKESVEFTYEGSFNSGNKFDGFATLHVVQVHAFKYHVRVHMLLKSMSQ
jgi:hypothetical protein